MRFRIQGRMNASPDEVMRYYHDRVDEVAGDLENVARVEVIEREPARTRLRWFAKGDIPKAFHRVIRPDQLHWEDEMMWNFEEREAVGRIFRPDLKALRCETRVLVREHEDGGSAYRVEGDLRIDMPMFGLMLERFFVGITEKNVRQFYTLLGERIDAEHALKGETARAEAAAEAPDAPPVDAPADAGEANEPKLGEEEA